MLELWILLTFDRIGHIFSDNSLYRWRQEFRRDGKQAYPGKGRLKADDEYIRQLERELKVVTQERDILKKAVSIFSKNPNQ